MKIIDAHESQFDIFSETQFVFNLQMMDNHDESPTTSSFSGLTLRYFQGYFI